MNAGVQREDGFVHHVFRGDLKHIDEDGFERVDMNPQFVMLVWRDFLWTGDMEFLRRLWPHVRNAMEAMAGLDRDGDALPDFETKRNTYDAWDFRGAFPRTFQASRSPPTRLPPESRNHWKKKPASGNGATPCAKAPQQWTQSSGTETITAYGLTGGTGTSAAWPTRSAAIGSRRSWDSVRCSARSGYARRPSPYCTATSRPKAGSSTPHIRQTPNLNRPLISTPRLPRTGPG